MIRNRLETPAHLRVMFDHAAIAPRIRNHYFTYFRGSDRGMPGDRYRMTDDGRAVEFTIRDGEEVVLARALYSPGDEEWECAAVGLRLVEVHAGGTVTAAPQRFACADFRREEMDRVLELRRTVASGPVPSF